MLRAAGAAVKSDLESSLRPVKRFLMICIVFRSAMRFWSALERSNFIEANSNDFDACWERIGLCFEALCDFEARSNDLETLSRPIRTISMLVGNARRFWFASERFRCFSNRFLVFDAFERFLWISLLSHDFVFLSVVVAMSYRNLRALELFWVSLAENQNTFDPIFVGSISILDHMYA